MADETGIAALQARHGLPGHVQIAPGRGGLPRLRMTSEAGETEIYLQGATITHYRPRGGEPLLFLSEQSRFQSGLPIRGGIPIVFPWFGTHPADPAAPMHGFARTATWELLRTQRKADGGLEALFGLDAARATHPAWPHPYHLRYRVALGSRLEVELEIRAGGEHSVAVEAALHTYCRVVDATRATVAGLSEAAYIDKVDGFARKRQGPEPIRVTGETDRVYLSTAAACCLDDPAGHRRIVVEKRGSLTTVIWNPWAAKAQALSDLGDEEWRQMLCIETADAADNRLLLPPGLPFRIAACLYAEPLG